MNLATFCLDFSSLCVV